MPKYCGECLIWPAGVSEIAAEVRRRAERLCEYCHLPEAAFKRPSHIEHIVAKQHSGQTRLDNLALACWACNLKKGPNLTGIDPKTGEILGCSIREGIDGITISHSR